MLRGIRPIRVLRRGNESNDFLGGGYVHRSSGRNLVDERQVRGVGLGHVRGRGGNGR